MSLAALRLARTEGVGTQTWRRLLERFGSAEAALEALPRFSKGKLTPFDAGEARREHDAVLALGGTWLVLGEEGYPILLAELYDAPAVLAVLGDPALLHGRTVAIVGARNASASARRMAEDLAEGLAKQGLVVASGLARGIDAAAHEGALRAGATVAAVAGGLDLPYPPENAPLQARIAAGGAVVAEAPLGTAPLSRHFPKRNRIIAGLSLGVIVIEAAPQSGTLITATMAVEAGREVFAVPGSPLDPRCRGSNDLIRRGAHFTETVEDVLAHLPEAPRAGPLFPARGPRRGRQPPPAEQSLLAEEPPPDSDAAAQVFDLIGSSPVPVDEVMRRCHLSPSAVQAVLLDLELSGRVELLPGNRVARTG